MREARPHPPTPERLRAAQRQGDVATSPLLSKALLAALFCLVVVQGAPAALERFRSVFAQLAAAVAGPLAHPSTPERRAWPRSPVSATRGGIQGTTTRSLARRPPSAARAHAEGMVAGPPDVIAVAKGLVAGLAVPGLVVVAVLALAGLALRRAQVGPVLAFASLSPRLDRLHPGQARARWRRVWPPSAWLQGIVRAAVVGLVAAAMFSTVVAWFAADAGLGADWLRPSAHGTRAALFHRLAVLGQLCFPVAVGLVAACVAVGLADLWLRRRRRWLQLHMSTHELAQEERAREGNPEAKRALRQLRWSAYHRPARRKAMAAGNRASAGPRP